MNRTCYSVTPGARGPRSRQLARAASARIADGFTLMEVLVAVTVFSTAMALALVAYVAVLKRAFHSQELLKGATEVRLATDRISQAVRSAGLPPSVANGGLQLLVARPEFSYLVVTDGTQIDAVNNVRGFKANQRLLKLSNVVPSAILRSVFVSESRPPDSLSTTDDVAQYFISNTNKLASIEVRDVLAVGDTVTVPATAYGSEITPVVNNISNSSNGTQTVTFESNLGVDVPEGTRVRFTGGKRQMFEVVVSTDPKTNGNLRYYPDYDPRVATPAKFVVLARDIRANPLTDPTNAGSATTVPFAVTGQTVTINLQKGPPGSTAGRTVQGARTTVVTRNNPTLQ